MSSSFAPWNTFGHARRIAKVRQVETMLRGHQGHPRNFEPVRRVQALFTATRIAAPRPRALPGAPAHGTEGVHRTGVGSPPVEGSPSQEFRVGPPAAVYVLLSAMFVKPTLMS